MHEELKPLITGSEDIIAGSLDWRLLDATSPAAQKLAGIVKLEDILSAPNWAASLACRYALQRQRGELNPVELESLDDYLFRGHVEKIDPVQRLFWRAWYHNGITLKEIAEIFEHEPGGLQKGLADLKNDLHPVGRKHEQIYMPIESSESWMTFYDGFEDKYNQKLKNKCYAEFIPGKLWAGAYIGNDHAAKVRACQDILDMGLSHFIDLTMPFEVKKPWSYQRALKEASVAKKIQVAYTQYPLGFHTATSRQKMLGLLDLIQKSITSGQLIYLHAGHNLEGRTPMVLACWLIQQGLTPRHAIDQVTEFWLGTLPYLIRLPMSDKQVQFVLRWNHDLV